MGRRALRQSDPALDLSQHLRTLEQLPVPFDAEPIFGRVAPLEIEVGSGKGLFLASAAAAHPQRNYLGIEVVRKYARLAATRLARREFANAIVVHGDGLRLFHEMLPDRVAAAVHVYFPDPWWKKRHHKRRVMNEAFLRDVERTLQPGGSLHFWTDVQEYFQATLELIATVTTLAGPFDVPIPEPAHDLDYRTHFERRMRLHNLEVFRAEFQKR